MRRKTTRANSNSSTSSGHFKSNLMASMASQSLLGKAAGANLPIPMADAVAPFVATATQPPELVASVAESASPAQMRASTSIDFLSSSPNFSYSPFDAQSLDESTPDEFTPINFLHGISNINYDIVYSDNSADNSVSEENESSLKAAAPRALDLSLPADLDEFDPLRNDSQSEAVKKPQTMNLDEAKPTTLIESEDSPNQVHLPSPLKPTTDYRGFSGLNIPTISCHTGDFSSLGNLDTAEEKPKEEGK